MENIVVIVLLLLCILCIVTLYVLGIGRNNVKEDYRPYYTYPSKCYSCEAELPVHLRWMGQPTKCFSCERQMLMNNMSPTNAHPMKYY